jgi:glutamyl-tRNA reductase
MAVFVNVGLSHKQAPISVREQVAVSAEELPARLLRLTAVAGVHEALLIATCNRVEIFAFAEAASIAADLLAELGAAAAPHAVVRTEVEALRHLFRVAASLDSMVIGEAQILGQVKEAAAQAQAAGAVGAQLSAALARAVSSARRVRTDTAIARGALSLSSVAVALARKVLGDLAGRSVLLIGAGEMATLAARDLRAQGASELLVANRSAARAEELASQIGGAAVSLSELAALLERVDVAICSTGASAPIVSRELMARAVKARRYRPIFLIDLAVPRNVDPAANGLENVYVYDLDDLEGVAAQNRDLRDGEVGRAEAIVEEELQSFLASRREREGVPVLARLRAQAQAIADAEAERTLALLGPVGERQEKSVRAMAAAIVNKLLHAPTQRLRRDGGGSLGQAAAELFGLQEAGALQPDPGAAEPGMAAAEPGEGAANPSDELLKQSDAALKQSDGALNSSDAVMKSSEGAIKSPGAAVETSKGAVTPGGETAQGGAAPRESAG